MPYLKQKKKTYTKGAMPQQHVPKNDFSLSSYFHRLPLKPSYLEPNKEISPSMISKLSGSNHFLKAHQLKTMLPMLISLWEEPWRSHTSHLVKGYSIHIQHGINKEVSVTHHQIQYSICALSVLILTECSTTITVVPGVEWAGGTGAHSNI